MEAQRFDALALSIGRRGILAALMAFTPLAAEAGKKGQRRRKKRRRKRRQAEALRRQCFEACGEGCNCIYNVSGAIQCTGNFEAICAEDCSSDADCPIATSNGCFTSFQLNGSSKKLRFDCDYAVGVCVGLGSC